MKTSTYLALLGINLAYAVRLSDKTHATDLSQIKTNIPVQQLVQRLQNDANVPELEEMAQVEKQSLAEVSVSEQIKEAEQAALNKLHSISSLAQVEPPTAATGGVPIEQAAPVEASAAAEASPEEETASADEANVEADEAELEAEVVEPSTEKVDEEEATKEDASEDEKAEPAAEKVDEEAEPASEEGADEKEGDASTEESTESVEEKLQEKSSEIKEAEDAALKKLDNISAMAEEESESSQIEEAEEKALSKLDKISAMAETSSQEVAPAMKEVLAEKPATLAEEQEYTLEMAQQQIDIELAEVFTKSQ